MLLDDRPGEGVRHTLMSRRSLDLHVLHVCGTEVPRYVPRYLLRYLPRYLHRACHLALKPARSTS